MDMKELNRRISALGKRNAAVVAEVQALGLACLAQVAEHGNTSPINKLVGALTRSQVQAFSEWALAFGKLKKGNKADAEAGQFLVYDKTRETDYAGAEAKCWDTFAPEKADAVAKAFDLQKAMMQVLKKAAEAGQPQSIIDALGKAAGVDAAKVPKSVQALPEATV